MGIEQGQRPAILNPHHSENLGLRQYPRDCRLLMMRPPQGPCLNGIVHTQFELPVGYIEIPFPGGFPIKEKMTINTSFSQTPLPESTQLDLLAHLNWVKMDHMDVKSIGDMHVIKQLGIHPGDIYRGEGFGFEVFFIRSKGCSLSFRPVSLDGKTISYFHDVGKREKEIRRNGLDKAAMTADLFMKVFPNWELSLFPKPLQLS